MPVPVMETATPTPLPLVTSALRQAVNALYSTAYFHRCHPTSNHYALGSLDRSRRPGRKTRIEQRTSQFLLPREQSADLTTTYSANVVRRLLPTEETRCGGYCPPKEQGAAAIAHQRSKVRRLLPTKGARCGGSSPLRQQGGSATAH